MKPMNKKLMVAIAIAVMLFLFWMCGQTLWTCAYAKGYGDGYDYSFVRWDTAWQSGYNYALEELKGV